MATQAIYHTSARPAKYELSRVVRDARWKGEKLAVEMFGAIAGLGAPKFKPAHQTTSRARQWALQRRIKLAPICAGVARIVSKWILNLASECMADNTGRTIVRHLREMHREGARTYVYLTLEAAITWGYRIDSDGVVTHARSWEDKRARGIATVAIVLYHLRTKRKSQAYGQRYARARPLLEKQRK